MHIARQSGFTLLELIVVVVLVVLLFVIALDRLLPLRGAAEQAHVLHTVGALRSGLGMQAAARVLRREQSSLRELGEENPLGWLAVTPPLSDAATVEDMERGTWLWRDERKVIVYRLRYPEYVEGAWNDEWLRFRVRVESREDRITRLELAALEPAHWVLPDDMGPDALLPDE